MRDLISASFVLVCACSLVACSTRENVNDNKAAVVQKDTVQKPDVKFAIEATSAGLMEIRSGYLTSSNSINKDVKEFGQNMVSFHSEANKELRKIVEQQDIELPGVTDFSRQSKIDELKKKAGDDFDKAYIDMMVKQHEKYIAILQQEVKSGEDDALKMWAANKLPALQHNLKTAKDIQKRL